MATILGNTQVFWSALVGVLFLRESLSLRFVGATVVAFVGVVLLVGFGSQVELSPRYLLGVAMGLCTGVAYVSSSKLIDGGRSKLFEGQSPSEARGGRTRGV